MPSIPESLLHRYTREKRIKLDGKRVPLNTRLTEGSTLELYIKDEFFEKDEKNSFKKLIPNLNIVFEDERIRYDQPPQSQRIRSEWFGPAEFADVE